MATSLPFDMPFAEAAAHFRSKVPMTREEFDKLAEWAKGRAFMVATVSKAEVLQDIMDAVQVAIDQGLTLADFNAALADIMAARGWTGITPYHAENVLRTAIQQANGSGRLEQQQAQADDFPYWLFVAIIDDVTTDECEALNGTVFSIDDVEFWPPIWFQCRSGTEPLTEAEAAELGGPTDGSDLPEPNGFAGPGAGDSYEPDLSGLDASLAASVQDALDGFDAASIED